MRRFVSRSMPLETLTRTVSGVRYGAIFFPVSRTAKDGVAEITSSVPFRQSKSPLIFRLSGSRTPFSLEVLPGLCHLRPSPGMGPQIGHIMSVVAAAPWLRAVPQPPLPNYNCFSCYPPPKSSSDGN